MKPFRKILIFTLAFENTFITAVSVFMCYIAQHCSELAKNENVMFHVIHEAVIENRAFQPWNMSKLNISIKNSRRNSLKKKKKKLWFPFTIQVYLLVMKRWQWFQAICFCAPHCNFPKLNLKIITGKILCTQKCIRFRKWNGHGTNICIACYERHRSIVSSTTQIHTDSL